MPGTYNNRGGGGGQGGEFGNCTFNSGIASISIEGILNLLVFSLFRSRGILSGARDLNLLNILHQNKLV